MATKFNDLQDILEGVNDYLKKEFSLNTDARSYKGENAVDTTLPADWVEKLKPMSGGTDGGHEGDSGPERKRTSSGSQGTEPYIHKQLDNLNEKIDLLAKQMMESGNMSLGGDKMEVEEDVVEEDDGWEDIDDDMEDADADMDVSEEDIEVEEDYEEKMDHYKGGDMMMGGEQEGGSSEEDVVQALNEIKALLSQNLMAKQKVVDNANLEKRLNGLQKSLKSAVRKGVEEQLKKQGLQKSVSDEPVRKSVAVKTKSPASNVTKSQVSAVPDVAPSDISRETTFSSVYGDNDLAIKKAFNQNVKDLADKHEIEDLGGTFRMLNRAREQEVNPRMLNYLI